MWKDLKKRDLYLKKYKEENKEKIKKYKREYSHKYRQNPENRKENNESAKRYYKKNRLLILEKLKKDEKRREENRLRYHRNKKRYRERQRQRYKEIRMMVLNYYSKGKIQCDCCGESHIEFLTIDHIYNNGAEHKKQINNRNFTYWLYKNNYPSGFQVLCFNCNCAKSIYGQCPHKKEIFKEVKQNVRIRP